jgi:hypothetical protein
MANLAQQESAMLSAGPSAFFGLPSAVLIGTPRLTEKTFADVSKLTVAGSPHMLFRVTGCIVAQVVAMSNSALASTGSAAKLAVGHAGATGGYLPATTIGGGNFPAAGTVWTGDAAPTLLGKILSGTAQARYMQGPTPITATVTTGNLTTGSLTFYCVWHPVSSNGNVIPA